MSTYWDFRCMDHDPPIGSADEFTQHTEDVHYWRAVSLAHSRPLGPEEFCNTGDASRDYFENNARRFLVQHPRCRLELVSEYGERRPLPGPPEAAS